MDCTSHRRLLGDRDCVACGSPVLDPNPLLPSQDDSEHCSQSCRDWSRSHRGQKRPRPPCKTCGTRLHPAYAIEGRWCSMRCRDAAAKPPPLPDGPGQVWAIEAACIDVPSEVFFAEKGTASGAYAAAKRVCADCPVRTDCLDFALAVEGENRADRHGVWGGLTPNERDRLAKQQRTETADLAAILRARQRLREAVPA